MTNQCGNCRFFENGDVYDLAGEIRAFGFCRRFPPQFAGQGFGETPAGRTDPNEWSFPAVDPDFDVCGEWKRIDKSDV